MPTLQNLVVNDGAATPVAHTFTPQTISRDGLARLVESDGTPIGDKVVTVSLKRTETKVKGRFKIHVPIVVDETINGVVHPKVIRNAYVDVAVTFDPTSSVQERKDILAMASDAIKSDDTFMEGVFVNLEGIY